jgi:hypothetical protein
MATAKRKVSDATPKAVAYRDAYKAEFTAFANANPTATLAEKHAHATAKTAKLRNAMYGVA